jgi:hypothetical protein
MNSVQVTPLGTAIAPTAPAQSAAGSASGVSTAPPVAPIQHAAPPPVQPIEKKVDPPPPPPPPVVQDKPRFARNVGFFPNSLKVFIDLVDPNNSNLSYRIYGPRTPAPAPKPIEVKGSPSDASAAYGRGPAPGGKDVAIV